MSGELLLRGRGHEAVPVDLRTTTRPDWPPTPVDEAPGGHLVALSRPVELADRLEAYLSR